MDTGKNYCHLALRSVIIRYLKYLVKSRKPSPLAPVVVVCMVSGGAGCGAGYALPLVYEDLVVVVLAGLRRLHLHQVLHLQLLLAAGLYGGSYTVSRYTGHSVLLITAL